jgi:hypothetical protein
VDGEQRQGEQRGREAGLALGEPGEQHRESEQPDAAKRGHRHNPDGVTSFASRKIVRHPALGEQADRASR